MTREQALAAVSRWVERIGASGDTALSLQDAAVQDAVRLAQLIDGGPVDHQAMPPTSTWVPNGRIWLTYCRHVQRGR